MKSRVQGIRAGLASAAAAATTMVWALPALASELRVGQPTPGAIGLQPGVTPLKHDATFFHNVVLLPIITVITLFVLALLVWVMVRYNKKANPTPAKWSHNTTIEVVWTIVPVLILMFIAIFSFRLLYAYHDMPKPYMTVKATGYQWYWGYEYPDDAVPGRLNETWFKAEREGLYYGQCSELCGRDHAFMPIAIRVVTQEQFDAWKAAAAGDLEGANKALMAATDGATRLAGN